MIVFRLWHKEDANFRQEEKIEVVSHSKIFRIILSSSGPNVKVKTRPRARVNNGLMRPPTHHHPP